MPIPTPRLKVFPNPWTYIDHLGRPAGVLPFDYFEHTKAKGWVGAEIVEAKVVRPAPTIRIQGQDVEIRVGSHDIRFGYSKTAVEIPNTAYYRQHIKSGDLIAADERTAREAGSLVGAAKFVKPEDALKAAREEALKRFDAETGENAWEAFGKQDVSYLEGDAEPAPAPAPAKNRVADAKGSDQ